VRRHRLPFLNAFISCLGYIYGMVVELVHRHYPYRALLLGRNSNSVTAIGENAGNAYVCKCKRTYRRHNPHASCTYAWSSRRVRSVKPRNASARIRLKRRLCGTLQGAYALSWNVQLRGFRAYFITCVLACARLRVR